MVKFTPVLFLTVLLATSCTSNKLMVSPPFTTSTAISALSPGMSQQEVESKLGISAYEVLSSVDGDMWVSYNYRVTTYMMPITNYAEGLAVGTLILSRPPWTTRPHATKVYCNMATGACCTCFTKKASLRAR